jgi:nucleoside-diphosphate-sugar epimerase
MKIVVTGAAGLLGQNLIRRLWSQGVRDIVAIDKHPANTRILRRLNPDLHVVEADLAEPGPWQNELNGAGCVIMGHAQIGGLVEDEFTRNNITATVQVLKALAGRTDCRIIHISSSVVNSAAVDFYSQSKRAQEKLVLAAAHTTVVLRPTLMFGLFDRKHLGWLARFMKRAPVFPIPGSGKYLRQPLYVGDFCAIIEACIKGTVTQGIYDITGLERVFYNDLMRKVRSATRCRTPIVTIPYNLFWLLLRSYALVNRNPPFTTQQLEALVTPDVFPIIDWPGIFGVQATPLEVALGETFKDSPAASVVLEF